MPSENSARRRAVFLDRDGVLNACTLREGRPFPPTGLEQTQILPRVKEACEALRRAGYLLILVTNQPDVARGTQRREVVDAINGHLKQELGLDDVRVCAHDDVDNCECRKPRPGLLLQAADEWGIDLGLSVMVGDRWRDIEAGAAAGCRTVFIDCGYHEKAPPRPDLVVGSLAEAVPWIVANGDE